MTAEIPEQYYDPMALYADVDASLNESDVIRTHPRGTGDWTAKVVYLPDAHGVPRAFPVENLINAELFGELPKPRISRDSDSFD